MSYFERMKIKYENLRHKENVIILAIESSCDETSIAVVKNGREVLSNIVSSQIPIHERFGGVVPEVASRNHITAISNVFNETIKKANITIEDIDAVAVTIGVGLIGALFVGVNFAKGLAYQLDVPLIAVNHIAGHLASNYIAYPSLEPPFICLVISGGHTSLFMINDYCDWTLIGQTMDDAVGECFDKVAREVGLGYPGGPKVEKMAKEGQNNIEFRKQNSFKHSYNFSFSGIKTAVINYIHNKRQSGEELNVADVCCSFQNLVTKELVSKSIRLCEEKQIKKLVLAGGVSANRFIANNMIEVGAKYNIEVYVPPIELCTDNASMIGSQAYYNLLAGKGLCDLDIVPTTVINYTNI